MEGGAAVRGWALARVSERPAEAALADGEALVASLRRPGRSVPVRERLSGEPLRRLRVLFYYVPSRCAHGPWAGGLWAVDCVSASMRPAD